MQLTQSDKRALMAMFESGQFADAHARTCTLIEAFPQAIDAWNIRGAAAVRLGQLEDAQLSFEKLEELVPNSASGPYNLGVVFEKQGADEKAIDAYARAAALAPNWGMAHNNLGHVYLRLGHVDAAFQHLARAAQLRPDAPEVQNNFGSVLKRLNRLDEARPAFERAIRLEPKLAIAHYNLGVLESEQGNHSAAKKAFTKASELEPDNTAARAMLLFELAHECDFEELSKYKELVPRLGVETKAVPPFVMLSLEDNPAHQVARARKWAQARFGKIEPQHRVFALPKERPQRLRIGYLSADFHDHPGMRLMTGMLAAHDRSRFKVHAISYGSPKDDEWRAKAKSAVDVFHNVHGRTDAEVTELLDTLNLDIAIDRQGYTSGSRIDWLAKRIAPVQISYLGYCSTTAAPFFDYMFADRIIIPPEQREHYAENIIWLPGSYQPGNNQLDISTQPTTRADHGLSEEAIVLCCFNNLYKITPEVFAVWTRILRRTPDSVLWLFASNGAAQTNLRNALTSSGIAPERLIFAPRIPHAEHLERHRHADLFLDTAPYGAHATSNDALWAGLPVVTRMGDQMSARVAASLLHALGMPELVTQSWGEYEALIVELACDQYRLRAIRKKLAEQRLKTPMFDTAAYTRGLEAGYDAAYDRFLRSLPAADISLERGA